MVYLSGSEQIEKYNEATEVKDHGKFILMTPIEVCTNTMLVITLS